MDKKEILRLYDEQLRQKGTYPWYTREESEHIVRYISAGPQHGRSFIGYNHLTAKNADTIIDQELAHFKRLDRDIEWKAFQHDTPPDLESRLVAHGFTLDDDPDYVMVLDLQEAPAIYAEPVRVTIKQIRKLEEVGVVAGVESAVLGGDFSWLTHRLQLLLQHYPAYLSIHVAYVNEKAVAVGWTHFYEGSQFATLWGGATLPEYRQQGFYIALVISRAQEAVQRGYRFLTIDAGSMSRPIVAKRGFIHLTTTYDCLWEP